MTEKSNTRRSTLIKWLLNCLFSFYCCRQGALLDAAPIKESLDEERIFTGSENITDFKSNSERDLLISKFDIFHLHTDTHTFLMILKCIHEFLKANIYILYIYKNYKIANMNTNMNIWQALAVQRIFLLALMFKN